MIIRLATLCDSASLSQTPYNLVTNDHASFRRLINNSCSARAEKPKQSLRLKDYNEGVYLATDEQSHSAHV